MNVPLILKVRDVMRAKLIIGHFESVKKVEALSKKNLEMAADVFSQQTKNNFSNC